MPATKEQRDARKAKTHQFSRKIALMTSEQRAELAEKIPHCFNPEGRQLSANNTILLSMQSGRGDLTMVAGFRQWQKAGRTVKKGETSIGAIQVPMVKKTQDGEEKVRFRLVSVFCVTQTEETAN